MQPLDPDGHVGAFLVVYEPDGEVALVRLLGLVATPFHALQVVFDGEELILGGTVPQLEGYDLDGDNVNDVEAFGYPDIFVARIDADGELAASRQWGDGNSQLAYPLRLRGDGALIVAGSYCGELEMAGCTAVPLVACGALAVFVAELTAELDCTALAAYQSSGLSFATDVAVAEDGAIALSGSHQGALELAADVTLNAVSQPRDTQYDGFVATFTGVGGELVGSAQMGPNRFVYPVFHPFEEDVFLAGPLAELPAYLGGPAMSSGPVDLFATRMGLDGSSTYWSFLEGGPGNDRGRVAFTPGGLVAYGGFTGDATFGELQLTARSGADGMLLSIDEVSGDIVDGEVFAGTGDEVIEFYERTSDAEVIVGTFTATLAGMTSEGADDLFIMRRPVR